MNNKNDTVDHYNRFNDDGYGIKSVPDAYGNTMEDYDRWGTPKGILKAISEPTPAQKKSAAETNTQRESTAAPKRKSSD